MIKTEIKNVCQVFDLGLLSYHDAYALQMEKVKSVQKGALDQMIVCEHPPTITCGRMSHNHNFLLSPEKIKQDGIDIIKVDRGGDLTLHAPGQLVVYPILNLKKYGMDLHKYLRQLEEVVIDLLKQFDILAERHRTETGVWVKGKKIASMGIGVKRWVSYHGIGLNVSTDLTLYRYIRPCGLDVGMTSIEEILSSQIEISSVKELVKDSFSKIFDVKIED